MKLSDQLTIKSSNINLLRTLAAVGVIWGHAYLFSENLTEPIQRMIHGVTNFGISGIAVCVLFFISGLYVTKSLSKSKGIWHFLLKRVVRILPQLIIVVVLSVFLLGPLMTTLSVKTYFSTAYKYLLNGILVPVYSLPGVFEQNIYDAAVNGPLWTLPVEMIAYVTLAVAKACSLWTKGKIKEKHCHLLAVSLTFGVFLFAEFALSSAYLARLMRPIVIFYIGCVFYDYADKIPLKGGICVGCAVLLLLSNYLNCFDIAIVLLLPYIIVYLGLGVRQLPLNGKLLLISYELYLLAAPIQQTLIACFGGSMPHLLNFVLTLVIDAVLAYGLYEVVNGMKKYCKKVLLKTKGHNDIQKGDG